MTELPEPAATIFVVDDDPAARISLSALVRLRRMPVEDFESGEAFLAAFVPKRPGVLITDLRMQGISGIELQEKLTERGSLLPIIFVSGHADVPATVRLMENGAITLLQKPYQESELLAAIDRAMMHGTRSRTLAERNQKVAERLASLNEEEMRILQLMVAGKANKIIARDLDSSMRTVDRRRRSVLNKMKVDTVAELARIVAQQQLSEQPFLIGPNSTSSAS